MSSHQLVASSLVASADDDDDSSTSSTSPLLRVATAQRVLMFAGTDVKRVVQLCTVTSTFHDTIFNYGGPVFNKALPSKRFVFFPLWYDLCGRVGSMWLVRMAERVWSVERGHKPATLIKLVPQRCNASCLHAAAERCRVDIFRFLLQLGGDVNIAGKNAAAAVGQGSCSPLGAACAAGCLEIVRMLFDYKPKSKKNSLQHGGAVEMRAACKSGNVELVKFLMAVPPAVPAFASKTNEDNDDGRPSNNNHGRHRGGGAADHDDGTDRLAQYPLDMQTAKLKNIGMYTQPWFAAISGLHVPLVRFLLENGGAYNNLPSTVAAPAAAPTNDDDHHDNEKEQQRRQSRQLEAAFERSTAIDTLLETCRGPLDDEAKRSKQVEILNLILTNNLSFADDAVVFLFRRFHVLCSSGSPDVLRVLLRLNADAPGRLPSGRFASNLSMLSHACAAARPDMLRFLIREHGLDPANEEHMHHGHREFGVFCVFPSYTCTIDLSSWRSHCPVGLYAPGLWNPWHEELSAPSASHVELAIRNYIEVLRILVKECKCDVNAVCDTPGGPQYGRTILHRVVRFEGACPIVKLLVAELGFDLKKANSESRQERGGNVTPAELAEKLENAPVAEYLRSREKEMMST